MDVIPPFLFRVSKHCKSALPEKLDNIGLPAVMEVHEDTKAAPGEGDPSYSTTKKRDTESRCGSERHLCGGPFFSQAALTEKTTKVK